MIPRLKKYNTYQQVIFSMGEMLRSILAKLHFAKLDPGVL